MGRIANMLKNGEIPIEEIGKADLEEFMERMQKAEKLTKSWKKVFLFPINTDEICVYRDKDSGDEYYVNKEGRFRIYTTDYDGGHNHTVNLNMIDDCLNLLGAKHQYGGSFDPAAKPLKEFLDSVLEKADKI